MIEEELISFIFNNSLLDYSESEILSKILLKEFNVSIKENN